MSRGYGGTSGPVEAFTNNIPIGAAIGAGAYVLNYIVMYLFITIDGVEGGEMWKSAGLVLYSAHFVETETTVSAFGQTQTSTTNLLSNAGGNLTSTIPEMVYYVLPIVVLIAAGIFAAGQVRSRLDTAGAAAAGATIVGGYLILSIVGVFLFEASFGGMGSSQPQLTTAVLIAGLAFPIVLGGIGGAVSNEL